MGNHTIPGLAICFGQFFEVVRCQPALGFQADLAQLVKTLVQSFEFALSNLVRLFAVKNCFDLQVNEEVEVLAER